jgi:hypothetical protein
LNPECWAITAQRGEIYLVEDLDLRKMPQKLGDKTRALVKLMTKPI